MESVPKGVRKDRNENEEHADLEEKTSLKLAKEKNITFKALSGKRKDKKTDGFLWTRYLQVSYNRLSCIVCNVRNLEDKLSCGTSIGISSRDPERVLGHHPAGIICRNV